MLLSTLETVVTRPDSAFRSCSSNYTLNRFHVMGLVRGLCKAFDKVFILFIFPTALIFGLLANRGYTGLSLHQYAEPYLSEQLETVGAMQNPAWAASLRSDASVIAASYNKTLASCPRVKQLPLGEAGLTALWLRYGGQRTPALTEFPPRLAAPLSGLVDTPDTAIVTVPANTAAALLRLRQREGLLQYVLVVKGGSGASMVATDPSGGKPAPTKVLAHSAGADLYMSNSFELRVSTSGEPITLLVTTRRKPLQSFPADLVNRFLLLAEGVRDKTLAPQVQQSSPLWQCVYDARRPSGATHPPTASIETYVPDAHNSVL